MPSNPLDHEGGQLDLCIVTYNRPALALAMAQAFVRADPPSRRGVRLTFVNNGAPFPDEVLQRWPPEVSLHGAPSNLGVAGGRNFGARLARGEYLAFLDDDLELDFTALLTQMRRDIRDLENWVAITYQVVRADGRFHRSEVPHKNGIDVLSHGSDVPYVLGGCLLLRRKPFVDEGGFTDQLGLYGMEEIEYSYRQHVNNRRLRYSHRVRIVHLKDSAGRFPAIEERLRVAIGRLRLARTFLPKRHQLTHVLAWTGWLLFHTRSPRAAFRLLSEGSKSLRTTSLESSVRELVASRVARLGGRVYR